MGSNRFSKILLYKFLLISNYFKNNKRLFYYIYLMFYQLWNGNEVLIIKDH